MADKISCGLILLAAGASTRMGRPKQLLPMYGNRPLLRHVVESTLTEPVFPIVVVLGANTREVAPCLAGLLVRIVVNPDWAEGMGSSLRCGVEQLIATAPTIQSVIVALADQPDLPAGHFLRLIETQRITSQPIIASECEGVRGPPVLFTTKYFPALRAMRGDTGARVLLKTHANDVATVPLHAARDLDTPADYADYLEQNAPRVTQIDADKS